MSLDPNELFKKGIDMYNIWYKFLNREAYNYEAYEFFEKAKNKYNIDKNYEKMSECYDWMVKCLLDCKSLNEFINIAVLYKDNGDLIHTKLLNWSKANEYYNKAITIFTDNGDIKNIIKIKEKQGEYYRAAEEHDNAIVTFASILDLYEDKNYSYTKTCKILFELYVITNNYEKSFEVVNKLANNNKNLLYTSAEYIYYAMLNYIILDHELAETKLEQYCDLHPYFKTHTKCKIIKNIINAISTNDTFILNTANSNASNITSQLFGNIAIENKLFLEIQKIITDGESLL